MGREKDCTPAVSMSRWVRAVENCHPSFWGICPILENIFGGYRSHWRGVDEAASLVGVGRGRGKFSDIWHSLGRLGCGSRMKGCSIHRCLSQTEMVLVVGGGQAVVKRKVMIGSEGACDLFPYRGHIGPVKPL